MIDLADTAAVTAYGRDASDVALLNEIAHAVPALAPDDFVRALDQLERAVSSADAKRAKRAAGWFGRMLGNDIQAQAEGDALRARMGVLLGDARREAERVQAAQAHLATLQDRLDAMIERIDADVAAGNALLDAQPALEQHAESPAERFRRRLAHLAAVAASHRTTREHLRLARTQCERILERHADLHALLGPVWTQHRIATRER